MFMATIALLVNFLVAAPMDFASLIAGPGDEVQVNDGGSSLPPRQVTDGGSSLPPRN
jgi:hypothetical protein